MFVKNTKYTYTGCVGKIKVNMYFSDQTSFNFHFEGFGGRKKKRVNTPLDVYQTIYFYLLMMAVSSENCEDSLWNGTLSGRGWKLISQWGNSQNYIFTLKHMGFRLFALTIVLYSSYSPHSFL